MKFINSKYCLSFHVHVALFFINSCLLLFSFSSRYCTWLDRLTSLQTTLYFLWEFNFAKMRPYFARTNLRDLKAKCTPREFNFPNYRHCLILQTLSDIKIETQKQKCKFYCISVNFKFLRLFLRKLIFAIFFFNRSPCFCCLDEYIFINDKYVYAAIPRQLLVFSAGNSGGTRYQNYCPLYN